MAPEAQRSIQHSCFITNNIVNRLKECGKYAWPALMLDVETVGRLLPGLSSTVMENSTKLAANHRAKQAVKWHSQLEIAMMQKRIEAPKVEQAKQVEQEADVRKQLVEVIASKLIVLDKLYGIGREGGERNRGFGYCPHDSRIGNNSEQGSK